MHVLTHNLSCGAVKALQKQREKASFLTHKISQKCEKDCFGKGHRQENVWRAATKSYVSKCACATFSLSKYREMLFVKGEKYCDKRHTLPVKERYFEKGEYTVGTMYSPGRAIQRDANLPPSRLVSTISLKEKEIADINLLPQWSRINHHRQPPTLFFTLPSWFYLQRRAPPA